MIILACLDSVVSECGFPGVPVGVTMSRQSRLSLTYVEGETISASCAFNYYPNRVRQFLEQHHEFVSPVFAVNYTLKCSGMNQWIIKSSPENVDWRSCSQPARVLSIDRIESVSMDGLMQIPVVFENGRSDCFYSLLEVPQKWSITFDEVTPCVITLSLTSPVNRKMQELELVDESGNFTCSFLGYNYHYKDGQSKRKIQATFVCSPLKTPKLIGESKRPSIDRILIQVKAPNNNPFYSTSYLYSSFFTEVSLCGISVYECPSSCGSHPLPVNSVAKEKIEGGSISKVTYSCEGDSLIKTSKEYDEYLGIVCGYDGSWTSSPPVCLLNPTPSMSTQILDWFSFPGDCVACLAILFFLFFLVILGTLLVFLMSINYVWSKRRREEDRFIQARESLVWIRRNFIHSNSLNESNPRESLLRTARDGRSQVDQSQPRSSERKKKFKRQTSSLMRCDPSHSYIDLRGGMIDGEIESVIPFSDEPLPILQLLVDSTDGGSNTTIIEPEIN